MSQWGSNTYAVAEPVGAAPKDFGKGRACEKCGGPVSRYRTKTRGYLLCNACLNAASRLGMAVPVFVNRPPEHGEERAEPTTRRNRSWKRGVYLPGLDSAISEKGWTCAKLGRKAGTTGTQVARLRRLGARASLETAGELARCLGVPVSGLTGEGA